MASITSAFQGRIMDCFRSFLLGKHVHMSAQICFIMSTISYSCVDRGMQIEICKFCARSAIKRKRAWIYQLIIALINIGGGGYNLCNPVVRDYPPRQIFTSAKLKKCVTLVVILGHPPALHHCLPVRLRLEEKEC